MIERQTFSQVLALLAEFPVVVVLGPRQVGKTTLAHQVAAAHPGSVLLDLERPSDLRRLDEAELYLEALAGRLVILDEVQRRPDLFPLLRSLVDARRARGQRTGQFLLTGSASLDLIGGSAESLAGRVAYLQLDPFILTETGRDSADRLWLRGGYPDSFLASSDAASLRWRQAFVRTYLERDVAQLAPRLPAEALRRLWTMLAHNQGALVNASRLAAGLGVSVPTVSRYLDLLADLFLLRRLEPWHANVGKRLVKSPKIYLRDSGIVHALLEVGTLDALLGHPVVGASYEGFVIDNLLASQPDATAWFYRTSAGAEADLLLEYASGRKILVEIKRSASPKPQRGFYVAAEDVGATERYIVYPGSESFPVGGGVTAIALADLMQRVSEPG